MWNRIAGLFAGTYLYELIAFVLILTAKLPRRRNFIPRFGAFLLLLLTEYAICGLLSQIYASPFSVGIYLVSLTVLCLMIHGCWQCEWWSAAYVTSTAYILQCAFYSLYIILVSSGKGRIYPGIEWRIYLPMGVVAMLLVRLILVPRIRFEHVKLPLLPILTIMGFNLILDAVFRYILGSSGALRTLTLPSFYVWKGMSVCENLFMLFILYTLLSLQHERTEREKIEELMRRQKKQFEVSRMGIELIQTKYHDLKKMLDILKKQPNIQESVLVLEKQIEHEACAVETGNEALNVILTEKKNECVRQGIRFTCVTNIEKLELDVIQLYSLFCNVMDNAIEAAVKLPEEEKRVIVLRVQQEQGLLSIHEENYYTGKIRRKNGLLATSKDESEHGYGLKSIRAVVQRYHGNMDFSAENGLFQLNILLLLPKGKEV